MEEFKIAKWGNSLAVRLPSSMVKRLGLKAGESIPAGLITGGEALRAQLESERLAQMMTREEATKRIREARKLFPKHLKPEDWKIDRNDPAMRG